MAGFLEVLAVVSLVRLAAENRTAGSAEPQIFGLSADLPVRQAGLAGFFIGGGYFHLRKMWAIFFFDGFMWHTIQSNLTSNEA